MLRVKQTGQLDTVDYNKDHMPKIIEAIDNLAWVPSGGSARVPCVEVESLIELRGSSWKDG